MLQGWFEPQVLRLLVYLFITPIVILLLVSAAVPTGLGSRMVAKGAVQVIPVLACGTVDGAHALAWIVAVVHVGYLDDAQLGVAPTIPVHLLDIIESALVLIAAAGRVGRRPGGELVHANLGHWLIIIHHV